MIGISIPIGSIQAIFFIFIRILSIAFALPFVRQRVPAPFITFFSLILATIVANTAEEVEGLFVNSLGVLVAGCIQEVLIGGLIGMLVYLTLETVQIAGRIVGFQMGFAMGAVIDPISGEQDTSLSQVYSILGGMLFLAVDGHLVIVKALVDSLRTLPPLFSFLEPRVFLEVLPIYSHIFITSIKIAGPVLATAILTTISFAISAKLAPQLNIFFILLPFKILLGLIALMLSLSVAGFVIRDFYENMLKSIVFIFSG